MRRDGQGGVGCSGRDERGAARPLRTHPADKCSPPEGKDQPLQKRRLHEPDQRQGRQQERSRDRRGCRAVHHRAQAQHDPGLHGRAAARRVQPPGKGERMEEAQECQGHNRLPQPTRNHPPLVGRAPRRAGGSAEVRPQAQDRASAATGLAVVWRRHAPQPVLQGNGRRQERGEDHAGLRGHRRIFGSVSRLSHIDKREP